MRSFTLRRVVPLAGLALVSFAASAVPAEPAAPALVAHDPEAPHEDADLHYASEARVGEALSAASPVDDEDQCDASASDSRSPMAPTAFALCDDWPDGGWPAASSPSLGHDGLVATSDPRSALCETVEVQGCPHWEARYEAEPITAGSAVTVSPDGGSVIVTGSSWPGYVEPGRSEPRSVVTVAYDADTGTQQWSKTWRPGFDADASGLAVAVTHDSSLVLVVARVVVTEVTDERIAVLAYDAATGDLEWSAWVNDSDAGAERDSMGGYHSSPPSPKQLTIAPDGHTVFLGFNSANPSQQEPGYDIVTVALDTASGDERWLNQYESPLSQAEADAVLPDPDGAHVYTVGDSLTEAGHRQVVLKIDAATGETVEEWLLTAHPGGESDTRDAALAGGRLVIAGLTTVAGQQGIGTVALDTATGTVQARGFTENPQDGDILVPVRVFASPDGDTALVAGGWVGGGSEFLDDFFAAAYDTTSGEQRWLTRLDGGGAWEILKDAALSPDGAHLVLTGWSRLLPAVCTPVGMVCKAKHPAYLTVAVDTQDGQLRWLHRYAATHAGVEISANEAYGVAIGPDGTAYVTGTFAQFYEEPGATWDSIYGTATLAYPRALDVLP